MNAAQTTNDADETEIDIVDAAKNLSNSFEEMSSLTDELAGTMTDVADGFASFSESTKKSRTNPTVEPSSGHRSSRAVADD